MGLKKQLKIFVLKGLVFAQVCNQSLNNLFDLTQNETILKYVTLMINSFSCLIEYLKHAKCYHKHQNEYKFCAEQYYSNYEKIKDNINDDRETQVKNWCWYVITRCVSTLIQLQIQIYEQ